MILALVLACSGSENDSKTGDGDAETPGDAILLSGREECRHYNS